MISKQLPTNVPIIKDGTITIHIYRGSLWLDEPIPIRSDPMASAFKYGEMWFNEVQKRYPRSTIYIVSRPGEFSEGGAVVDISPDHTNQEATMRNVLRLGQEVYSRRKDWLVWRGTKEAKRLRDKYQKVVEAAQDD